MHKKRPLGYPQAYFYIYKASLFSFSYLTRMNFHSIYFRSLYHFHFLYRFHIHFCRHGLISWYVPD